jgi:hypothetical protein
MVGKWNDFSDSNVTAGKCVRECLTKDSLAYQSREREGLKVRFRPNNQITFRQI